jgi:hypothetical protein
MDANEHRDGDYAISVSLYPDGVVKYKLEKYYHDVNGGCWYRVPLAYDDTSARYDSLSLDEVLGVYFDAVRLKAKDALGVPVMTITNYLPRIGI